jgi:hypothetical protein
MSQLTRHQHPDGGQYLAGQASTQVSEIAPKNIDINVKQKPCMPNFVFSRLQSIQDK